jgi:bacterioferritin
MTQPQTGDNAAKGKQTLLIDEAALAKARESLDDGTITPSFGPWRDPIVALLDTALATEIVCSLRYRRHYFTARGLSSGPIATEFLEHSDAEWAHADRLAERLMELGADPDFSPGTLLARSHSQYDTSVSLREMIRANLVAERIAIEVYRQMITLIGDKDPTSRRLLESLLQDEEEHASDLLDLLEEAQ